MTILIHNSLFCRVESCIQFKNSKISVCFCIFQAADGVVRKKILVKCFLMMKELVIAVRPPTMSPFWLNLQRTVAIVLWDMVCKIKLTNSQQTHMLLIDGGD